MVFCQRVGISCSFRAVAGVGSAANPGVSSIGFPWHARDLCWKKDLAVLSGPGCLAIEVEGVIAVSLDERPFPCDWCERVISFSLLLALVQASTRPPALVSLLYDAYRTECEPPE